MASLSSLGVGSGLDAETIVTQLVALEKKPATNLSSLNSKLETKVSTWGKIQSNFSSLQDAAGKLMDAAFWNATKGSSSDDTSVGISTSSLAAPGSFSVNVSQLAKEQPLKTVGDLFRAIAADQWWFKKVKGLGEQKRDALINATIAYREKFPVPDGDTRQKQCKDCDTLYPQAVGECPQCQSPYFNLTELAAAEQADPANEEQEAAAE